MFFAPLLLLLPALQDVETRPAGTPRAWEHETSDLAPDSRIRFGRFENGLRYAWMANAEPRERSYMRLHVDVGSLAEEDSERGMAHFLEHMAFNGSENFEAGTLIEWFQEHGMAFGADLNAMTSYSQTIYMLDLPRSDAEMLDEGLQVLRDWAQRLLLAETEVEKEKGVVDGEESESDSAGRRVYRGLMRSLYTDTRYPSREPIGIKEVRDEFSAESVRAFYQRWYRPENMTLLLVGDLGELDPVPLFEKHFADFGHPATPVEPEPALGRPEPEERYFCIHEPELPSVQLLLEMLSPFEEEPDNAKTRIEDLDLACARGMLNLRFAELARKEGTPFLSARVSSAGGLEIYEGESLEVNAEPLKWREAFLAAELELQRALEFGFQPAELEEVRADILRGLDESVERERTRHSGSLVTDLLQAAEVGTVPTDAASERALAKPAFEALTVEKCHAALVKAWSQGKPSLYSVGSLDLGLDAEPVLKALLADARDREVERGEEVDSQAFAYASDPEVSGEVVSEAHVEDFDAWLFTFANGVQLNVKKTDFKERQILVSARVAEGLLTVDPDEFAVGWVGGQVFNVAGLGEHTVDDLRRLTAGKRVRVGMTLSNDTILFSGSTTSEDLLLELELLRAHLADPGWRDDGLRMLRDRIPLMFERYEHVATGPIVLEFLPELFHGDRRFAGIPERAAMEAVDMEAVREWLAPLLAKGPIELTVVGDCDVQAVKEAVARTLGTLEPRRAIDPQEERRKASPPRAGLKMERSVETDDDKSFVFVAFPTGDGLEANRRRSIRFLSQVVQDRLRLHAREELGAAYSPTSSAEPSRIFPGVGLLTMSSSADPKKETLLLEAFLTVARDLHENGVTQEEIDRLTQPILASIRDAKRQNGFWIRGLGEAQSKPESLDDLRAMESFYEAVKAEELSELAQRYLDPENASTLVVSPGKASTPREASSKDE